MKLVNIFYVLAECYIKWHRLRAVLCCEHLLMVVRLSDREIIGEDH